MRDECNENESGMKNNSQVQYQMIRPEEIQQTMEEKSDETNEF